MLDRGVLLAAALAVCGSQAAALPVRVALDWPSGRPASALARARVEARSDGRSDRGRRAPSKPKPGADGVVLDLGDGVWQVQASVPGYWSQGAQVAVGRRGACRRAARALAGGGAARHGRGGRRRPAATRPRGPAERRPCCARRPLRGRRARSEPVARGAALPDRRGSVELPGSGRPVRRADRVAGVRSALRVGRASRGRGEHRSRPDRCCAERPRSSGVRFEGTARTRRVPVARPCGRTRGGAARRRPIRRARPKSEAVFSASLSRRGYFHVVGVPPGAHVLAVECPAASAVRELRVPADGETRIELPLEELTLDVVVTPKVDPEGRPWRVAVDRTAPRFRAIDGRATVSADGRWTRRGLTAGSYRVALEGSDGTQWLERFVDLDAAQRAAVAAPRARGGGGPGAAGHAAARRPAGLRQRGRRRAGDAHQRRRRTFPGPAAGRARRRGDALDRRGARRAAARPSTPAGRQRAVGGRRDGRLAGARAAHGRRARNRACPRGAHRRAAPRSRSKTRAEHERS